MLVFAELLILTLIVGAVVLAIVTARPKD